MFGDLLKKMMAPAPEQIEQTDARLALGALLVRIERSDEDYAEVEKTQIKTVLMARL